MFGCVYVLLCVTMISKNRGWGESVWNRCCHSEFVIPGVWGYCAGSAQFELVESTSEALERIGVGRGAAAAQGVLGVDGVDGVDKIGTNSARS